MEKGQKNYGGGRKRGGDTFFHYCGGRTKSFMIQKQTCKINYRENKKEIKNKNNSKNNLNEIKNEIKWKMKLNEKHLYFTYLVTLVCIPFYKKPFFLNNDSCIVFCLSLFVFCIVFCLWLFVYMLVAV